MWSGKSGEESEAGSDKSQEVEASKSTEDSSDSEVSGEKPQGVDASKSQEDPSDSEVIDINLKTKKEQNPCEFGDHSVD